MSITKEIDPVLNLFQNNCQQQKLNVDEQILNKYDENNLKFSIQTNEEERDNLIHCIYRYDNNQIQLEYDIFNQYWIIKSNFKEQESFLKEINEKKDLSLDQQIELIIEKFDQYFHQLSKPSTIIEVDEEQSESVDFNRLTPTIAPPKRVRHDSSCSSANSIKFTQFVPPSTNSVRRRRVIQSLQLHVQKKKHFFRKILKQEPTAPIIYQLGLEFLKIYDGKFNYPQGHTFVLSFKNRTWFLTINQIKCVECELGQTEPRSVLILQYKNKFTTVQV